jgi:hypothetical protein
VVCSGAMRPSRRALSIAAVLVHIACRESNPDFIEGGICADDAYEPNEAEAEAVLLDSSTLGTPGTPGITEGVLESAIEIDWFRFEVATKEPTLRAFAVALPADPATALDVCVYAECQMGTVSMKGCGGMSAAPIVFSELGRPGCCRDDSTSVAFSCEGAPSLQATVTLSISSRGGVCGDYELSYGLGFQ